MSYITWKEIGLEEATLLQLTDDEGAGTIRDDVIEDAIADAEAEIDSYASARYSVPLSSGGSTPAVVKSKCRALVIFKLFARKPDATIPEGVQKAQENALRWLERLSNGKVHLEAQTNLSQDERTASAGKVSGGERTFGRDNLDDF